MAVMASEGPTVDLKLPAKPPGVLDDQAPHSNGVNGHVETQNGDTKTTPGASPKVSSESAADKLDTKDSPAAHVGKNNDAFGSNQAVAAISRAVGDDELPGATIPVKEGETATDVVPEAPASALTDVAATDEVNAVEGSRSPPVAEITDASRDAEMTDAPPPEPESTDATDKGVAAAAATSEQSIQGDDVPPAANAEPSATVKETQSTVNTAADSQSSPVGGSNSQPPNLSDLAIDATQPSTAPETADTTMTDLPSQSAKNAREREDDDDDEPLAKRPRTQEPEAEPQKEVDPATALPDGKSDVPDAAQPTVDSQAMDIDKSQPASSDHVPEYPEAVPGSLIDPAVETRPISEYANREIRRVLAGVKKTKAGGLFKDSVAKLWPDLGDSYNALIDKPMDIGLMERNLRSSSYPDLLSFKEDVKLLVRNCVRFNGPEHNVTNSAIYLVRQIWDKMNESKAEEPPKTSKKEPKQISTREHRAVAQPRAKPAPPPPSVPAAAPAAAPAPVAAPSPTPPAQKVEEVPIHAAPPQAAAVPRRDSTRDDDRPKRPIHPPKKDLGYEPKGAKKKKLPPELKFCDDILKDLAKPKNHPVSWPFKLPVDEQRDGAYGYYKAITKPMDLQTIEHKMNDGDYASALEVKRDFDLIIKNCFLFNPEGTDVHTAGKGLEEFLKEKWPGLDAFVAKNATRAPARRASAVSPGAGPRDESEEDELLASDPEPDPDHDEIAQTEKELETLKNKINEEQNKMIEEMNKESTDALVIDVAQSIIGLLTKRVVEHKKKLEELKAKKPAPKPKPAAKSKKASATAAAAQAAAATAPVAPSEKPSKKAGGGGGRKSTAGGGGRKATSQRPMTAGMKEAIANGINNLAGNHLDTAIAIIKKDTHQEENSNGELELDIEQLSNQALHKLSDVMAKGIKGFKEQMDGLVTDEPAVRAPPSPPPAASNAALLAAKANKGKKHKPMGKSEQERKLKELENLKAKFARQSGSQEPPPSATSPTPAAAAGPALGDAADHESDEDSEED